MLVQIIMYAKNRVDWLRLEKIMTQFHPFSGTKRVCLKHILYTFSIKLKQLFVLALFNF